MAIPIVETRLTGFSQMWGECPPTSWKFAYSRPGEISPIKFFLVPYQKFQHVKYYLSRISISRNIKLKIQFFTHFGKFFKISFKTFGTLKMFLEVPKTILHYIRFICWRTCEKNSSLNFMSSIGFQSFEITFRQI